MYVLASEMLMVLSRKRKSIPFIMLALGAVMIVEYRMKISPTVCILDKEQNAYLAVSEDAEPRGVDPRVVVIPLWPGDSHWASLYEYYVSL